MTKEIWARRRPKKTGSSILKPKYQIPLRIRLSSRTHYVTKVSDYQVRRRGVWLRWWACLCWRCRVWDLCGRASWGRPCCSRWFAACSPASPGSPATKVGGSGQMSVIEPDPGLFFLSDSSTDKHLHIRQAVWQTRTQIRDPYNFVIRI